MTDSISQRMSQLSPAQRRLLAQRLKERRGADPNGGETGGEEPLIVDPLGDPDQAPVSGRSATGDHVGSSATGVMAERQRDGRRIAAPVAIVGAACRFPGANNLDEFWDLIRSGRDATGEIPPTRWDVEKYFDPTGTEPGKMSIRHGGFVDDVDRFDAAFFGITPREAARMDPQQRLLLETVYHAIEHAGVPIGQLAGSKTGVFVGIGGTDYSKIPAHFGDYLEQIDAHVGTGNALSVAAGRISYIYDLHGPSFIVDTACSSALVALHSGVSSLRDGDSDAALVAGVNLILSPETTIAFSKANMLSRDGRCRPFDADANGYVRGEGCGVVMLKRLDDATRDGDNVLGIIRGVAVNQDGRTAGITAPNGPSQRDCIVAAMKQAGVRPDEIRYIEAHGTATPLGDPIELGTLADLFAVRSAGAKNGSGASKNSGAIDSSTVYTTSVKANIGHTETVSGMAGLIKVLLMMRHDTIPAQTHLRNLNPKIDLERSRVQIPTTSVPWPGGASRIAGVSSFGFGGTNSHVILQAPESDAPIESDGRGSETAPPPYMVLPLSARSDEALTSLAKDYQAKAGEIPPADLCTAAAIFREALPRRGIVVARSEDDLTSRLTSLADRSSEADDRFSVTADSSGAIVTGRASATRRKLAMLMTGQGSQYAGMGKTLYETDPVFAATMDKAFEIVDRVRRESGEQDTRSLRDVMFADEASGDDTSLIHQTGFAQPAIVAFECAMVDRLNRLGVRPSSVCGHSVGEYAAAYAAGVMDLSQTMELITHRGRLMQSLPGGGGMMAVMSSVDDVNRGIQRCNLDERDVTIGAINGPASVVVSGRLESIAKLQKHFSGRDVVCKQLSVSHAFHSADMDPILEAFGRYAARIDFKKPNCEFLSGLLGRRLSHGLDADYWTDSLRRSVRFGECAQAMLDAKSKIDVILEVGPSPHLTGSAKRVEGSPGDESRQTPGVDRLWLFVAAPQVQDAALQWTKTVASLHVSGLSIDWASYYHVDGDDAATRRWRRRLRALDLPGYAFDKTRHWMESNVPSGSLAATEIHPLLGGRIDAAMEDTLFESRVSASRPGYLAEHEVLGGATMPAAGMIEIGLAAARWLLKTENPRIESFVIGQPMSLDAKRPRRLQTRVSPFREGRATWQLFGRDATDESASWTRHARGVIVETGSARRSDGHDVSCRDRIAETLADVVRFLDRDSFYDVMAGRQLNYGDRFRVLADVHRGRRSAVAEVWLDPSIVTAGGYLLHPALLDGAMQLTAALTPLQPDGSDSPATYMPVGVGSLQIVDRPGAAAPLAGRVKRMLAVRTWPSDEDLSADEELIRGDVTLLDDDDQPLVHLNDVQIRRVADSGGQDVDAMPLKRYQVDWKPVEIPGDASVPETVDGRKDSRQWLLIHDDRDGAESFVRQFLRESDVERVTIDDFLGDAGLSGEPSGRSSVIYLASPRVDDDDQDEPSLASRTTAATGTWLQTLQRLVRRDQAGGDVWLITRDAISIDTKDRTDSCRLDPTAAALWGMGRVAQNEHPELGLRLLDLGGDDDGVDRTGVLDRMIASGENQIAIRGGDALTSRLAVDEGAGEPDDQGRIILPRDRMFQVRLGGSHRIDDLRAVSHRLPPPSGEEVSIRVAAAGVNFSDVLKAMGLYPGITDSVVPLGIECAGVVTAVGDKVRDFAAGDRVFGVVPYGFASQVNTPEYAIASLPDSISWEEAATIPITFLTAHHALRRLADLQPGENVLIHAGAGGVGLAAIQIAQSVGAEVFATAGSDAKRDFLRQLGVRHVYNSRTLEFADQIPIDLRADHGTDARLDVVLNSLPGEAIDRSLELLGPYGRFLEIGKTEIYQNRAIGLSPFRDNLSYHAIDLDRVLRQRPGVVRQLFRELLGHLEAGDYRPLPSTNFDVRDLSEAFRYMAARRNIGKVVIRIADAAATVGHPTDEADRRDRGGELCLITGGTGAIGLRLAEHLIDRGRHDIALLSRSGPGDEAAGRIAAMREKGGRITVVRGDLSDGESLGQALRRLDRPVCQIMHAAGALDDNVLFDMTRAQLENVLAAKVSGIARLVDAAGRDTLQSVVLFSSIASLLGSPGQGNYAAANAFLDAYAGRLREQGIKAVSVNWGPWAEGGMATDTDRAANLAMRGLGLIEPDDALQILDEQLRRSADTIVMRADWSKMAGGRTADQLPSLLRDLAQTDAGADGPSDHPLRREVENLDAKPREDRLLADFSSQLAKIMGLDVDQLDVGESLAALGLDSLMAIELKNNIEKRLNVVLPMARFMEGPSLKQLAAQVGEMISSDQAVTMIETESGQPASADDTTGTIEHPLSEGQKSLWYLYQLAPESAAYNIADAVRVHGELDRDAVQIAVDRIVSRHESFRTTFPVDQGRPIARVDRDATTSIRWIDAAGWDQTKISDRVRGLVHAPFDLAAGPLLRISVLSLADDSHVLVFGVHHIVADFWSLVAVMAEFRDLYGRLVDDRSADLPAVKHQYRHFVDFQQRLLDSVEGKSQREFWTDTLSGELPVLDLPTDRPRPAVQTFNGRLAFRHLDRDDSDRVADFAKRHGMTVNAFLLAMYQLLLHRWSGQDDVLIGLPTSGRSRSDLTDVVGYFVNPVVVRSRLSDDSLDRFLRTSAKTTVDAMANQDYPLARIVDQLDVPRDPSRATLFQAMFVMQKSQAMHEEGLTAFLMGQSGAKVPVTGTLTFESMELEHYTAQFDLSLAASENSDGITLGLQYNSDLFDASTADDLLDRMTRIIESVTAESTSASESDGGPSAARISHVRWLAEDEQERLTNQWACGPVTASPPMLVHHSFERQVIRTPDALAVVDESTQWTYRELNHRANEIAHALMAQGLQPGQLVGVCLPRGASLLACLLGVLKAGGAYVPLDPKYPQARLQQIATQTNLFTTLDAATWDSLRKTKSPRRDDPRVAVDSDSLCYVIFTSGSTGQPKGAGVYHRGLAGLVRWYVDELSLDDSDAALVVTSHGFDLTQKNFFAPLAVGGNVVMSTPDVYDPKRIADEVESHHVTLINATPSVVYPLDEFADDGLQRLTSLKSIVLGGEPIDRSRLTGLGAQATIWNSYGPTECSDVVAAHRLTDEDGSVVPLGRPIDNVKLYVLDQDRRPVPVGVAGELFIGGDCVGAGYLNDAAMTRRKFVADPFHGSKMYASGDLARWLPDGKLEFLGRRDDQIKIRGHRLELGEIESELVRLESIAESCVVLRRDDRHERLIAYAVADTGPTPDAETVLTTLRSRLPIHAVPAAIVFLDKLPLSPHGKVDRRRLPSPDADAFGVSRSAPPRGDLENRLAAIWADVLRCEVASIGREDNFFLSGGDSLMAIQLVSRLAAAGHVVTPAMLLQAQTVAELATLIERQPLSPPPEHSGHVRRTTGPLTPLQRRLIDQNLVDVHHRLLGVTLSIDSEVDSERLHRVVDRLTRRHPAMRMGIDHSGAAWRQTEVRLSDDLLVVDDLRVLSGDDADEHYQDRLRRSAESIRIERGGPIRFVAAAMPSEPAETSEFRLTLLGHYLFMDPTSMRLLIEQLWNMYSKDEALNSNVTFHGPADYATELAEMAGAGVFDDQCDDWLAVTADSAGDRDLRVDRIEGSSYGESVSTSIEVDLDALGGTASPDGPWQRFAQVAAALADAWQSVSGDPVLPVDVETTGRLLDRPADASSIVGRLVSIFPVHVVAGASVASLAETLTGVRDDGVALAWLRSSDRPEVPTAIRQIPDSPVRLNFLGRMMDTDLLGNQVIGIDDRNLQPLLTDPANRRLHPIEIDIQVSGDRMQLRWTYPDRSEDRQLVEHWIRSVAQRLRAGQVAMP